MPHWRDFRCKHSSQAAPKGRVCGCPLRAFLEVPNKACWGDQGNNYSMQMSCDFCHWSFNMHSWVHVSPIQNLKLKSYVEIIISKNQMQAWKTFYFGHKITARWEEPRFPEEVGMGQIPLAGAGSEVKGTTVLSLWQFAVNSMALDKSFMPKVQRDMHFFWVHFNNSTFF